MTAEANIPFQTIDWNTIKKTIHPGQTGSAGWQTLQWPGLRLSGEFVSELQNGDSFKPGSGKSYIVSDELSSHRSHTTTGVKLLIIDGTFLKHL